MEPTPLFAATRDYACNFEKESPKPERNRESWRSLPKWTGLLVAFPRRRWQTLATPPVAQPIDLAA
jgi:hypothetical protein